MSSLLESSALSAFFESVAIMYAAGIQTDEAVNMLSESIEDTPFKSMCGELYQYMKDGTALSVAMKKTKAFPDFAINMIEVGESAGRLENVLRSLSTYYDEENRIFTKVRSSLGYPATLLIIMTVILCFTVFAIIPVFVSVYESISGSLTTGSFAEVGASIGIGWVSMVITFILAIIAVIAAVMSRTQSGRIHILKLMEKIPFTRKASYELGLSQFAASAASFIATGKNTDEAVEESINVIDNSQLKAKLIKVHEDMTDAANPRSFAQAISENDVFDPIYARMLTISTQSGGIDEVLDRLSSTFFDDAVIQIDKVIDNLEPILAAFMTVAVGATLVAVMLPLVAIVGSIG